MSSHKPQEIPLALSTERELPHSLQASGENKGAPPGIQRCGEQGPMCGEALVKNTAERRKLNIDGDLWDFTTPPPPHLSDLWGFILMPLSLLMCKIRKDQAGKFHPASHWLPHKARQELSHVFLPSQGVSFLILMR